MNYLQNFMKLWSGIDEEAKGLLGKFAVRVLQDENPSQYLKTVLRTAASTPIDSSETFRRAE